MSGLWFGLAAYVFVLALLLAFGSAYGVAVYGPQRFAQRGWPLLVGLWLPSVAVAYAAIWFYASVPSVPAWHWLAIGAGVVAWLIFFQLRRAIVRRHRARRGNPPPPPRKLTPREFWQGIRAAPRGRLIALGVVIAWAVAGIVGGVLTFVIKR